MAAQRRGLGARYGWGLLIGGYVLVSIAAVAWPVSVATVAVLLIARARWPKARMRYYFQTGRAVLPLVTAGGAACAMAAYALRGHTLPAIAWSAAAACALSIVLSVFEGKLMKSIFELVPVEQRRALDTFVAGDAADATWGGRFADFSKLDAAQVTTALQERVIGQDSITAAVVQTAMRRARLRRPAKPVATFLFVGATGSGKTELAKGLAAELFGLFGSEGALVRVDCAEMTTESSVVRLVGAPPGYIGSDRGSDFCRAIGRLGTGVILLDEIEKAHPAVLRAVMALLDEARITEQSTSTTFDARGFLIVMTSNAAAGEIAQIVDADPLDTPARAAKVKDALKSAGFLPEVLARIDAVYPFAKLSRAAMTEIVGRFLLGFARDAGVELASVDAALLIDLVTKQEAMQDYGVREVVRLVEGAVVDGLLSVKDASARAAAIRVADGQVVVEPA